MSGILRGKRGTYGGASAGSTPARSSSLKKRLRKLDRQIGHLDYQISLWPWNNKNKKRRAELDKRRLEVRNKLKYGDSP